jgi:ribose transport system substrate-binding protein
MTLKTVLLAAVTAASLSVPAFAADTYKFALIPKAMNNPYFDLSRDGCNAEAKKLGNVECVYKGPVEHEPATQVQIIQDMITGGIDGLAISVADADSVTKVIQQARDAKIPVITFDADAPNSARQSNIGTDNHAMGVALGETLKKLRPEGGTYAMVSGGPAAANLQDRVQGVRDGLKGSKWTELSSGSPTYCNDDLALAVQQMTDLKTAHPELAAIIPVGGWPMFVPEAYKSFVAKNKADMDAGKFTLVVADTLKVQLELLKDGYANALVGQRPYEMGAKAMDILLALKKGEKVETINRAGLDLVTKDNVDQMLKGM